VSVSEDGCSAEQKTSAVKVSNPSSALLAGTMRPTVPGPATASQLVASSVVVVASYLRESQGRIDAGLRY
jgi:hypothetical protein